MVGSPLSSLPLEVVPDTSRSLAAKAVKARKIAVIKAAKCGGEIEWLIDQVSYDSLTTGFDPLDNSCGLRNINSPHFLHPWYLYDAGGCDPANVSAFHKMAVSHYMFLPVSRKGVLPLSSASDN